MLRPGARVHFVGIGGAGMSALAWILLERGHPVTGSDLRGGRVVTQLSTMGAVVSVGHRAANVEGADVVVVSTAIAPTNPEPQHAETLGIPVVHRAELLAALVGSRRGVFVAGTHGKTTTTSMVVVALQAAGLDPSFAIGGTLHGQGVGAHHGAGDVFVAEADESDRSFLAYTPDCAVVTNVELDHHDTFADVDDVVAAFASFLGRRGPDGLAIVCADDPLAAALAGAQEPGDVVTYGTSQLAHLVIEDMALDATGSTFALRDRETDLGTFRLAVPGAHNVRNAAAAVAAARWAGADLEAVRHGLADFAGAHRRFQRLGEAAGVLVVDDYAHHPTELTATIAAARQVAPAGRVIAAFQPHRYSRTAALAHELGQALADADVVVVTDVYAAGEEPVPGVTGSLVAEAAAGAGASTTFVPALGDLADAIARIVQHGDLVLTLGAGDVTEVGPVLLRLLAGGRG